MVKDSVEYIKIKQKQFNEKLRLRYCTPFNSQSIFFPKAYGEVDIDTNKTALRFIPSLIPIGNMAKPDEKRIGCLKLINGNLNDLIKCMGKPMNATDIFWSHIWALHDKFIKGKNKNNGHTDYVIDFGKFKGTSINQMQSDDQLAYCQWMYEQMQDDRPRKQKKNKQKMDAFKWWLGQNTERLNTCLLYTSPSPRDS